MVVKRPLCTSQINYKIIKKQGCHRQLTLRAGDWLEEVTVKAVLNVTNQLIQNFY